MSVNGKYFQKKKMPNGQLKAFVGLNEIEPGEDDFMNMYADLSQGLTSKLETDLALTAQELGEVKNLAWGVRSSVAWQLNISNTLDYAGLDDEEEFDDDAELAAKMKARCSLKQTISKKLSPKKNSRA